MKLLCSRNREICAIINIKYEKIKKLEKEIKELEEAYLNEEDNISELYNEILSKVIEKDLNIERMKDSTFVSKEYLELAIKELEELEKELSIVSKEYSRIKGY